MTQADSGGDSRPRRWGTASALLDDQEARRRLVAAAARCLVRRGTARISMDEVADEAGVVRSTLYRYYRNREELVLAVMMSRLDEALDHVVRSLEAPDDAARSIPELILVSAGLVAGDAVNEALFSSDSRSLVTAVELTAQPIVDGVYRHVAPLLRQWQADGQVHKDLDLRMTARWLNQVSATLMLPPWREMSLAEKRAYLDHYVVRALLAR